MKLDSLRHNALELRSPTFCVGIGRGHVTSNIEADSRIHHPGQNATACPVRSSEMLGASDGDYRHLYMLGCHALRALLLGEEAQNPLHKQVSCLGIVG